MVQLSHPYMISGKTMTLTIWTFVSKVMSLFFNMLSRFVITFLPRKVISWLRSQSAVTLKPKKRNFVTPSTFLPSICHEVMEPDAMIFVFWMLSFKPFFSLSSFTLIKRLFSSSSLSFLLFFFSPLVVLKRRKRGTEDEMVGGHHQLKGYKSEQVPGDGEGQGGLARCSTWGHKESDTT